MFNDLQWEKKLLEEQLKVSRLETQKAQVETEKAKLEEQKAKMETINVGLQAELKMMKFQQQDQLKMGVDKGELSTNNSSKLEQRIADLEAEMAKQNGQLRESLQVVIINSCN